MIATAGIKKTVAVTEFEPGSAEARDKKLGRAAADLFVSTFVEQGRITVVEREKIESILKEQTLQVSDLVNEKTAVQVGMLSGAQIIVVGNVSPVADMFLISARAIEVESGKVVAAGSVKVKRKGLITLASRLLVIKKYASTAAFYSLVVPGWGQFYNDQPGKGTFLGLAAGISLAGVVTTSVLYTMDKNKYNENKPETVHYRQDANDLRPWNWVSIGALATVWTYGVLDAYLEARHQLKEAEKESRSGKVAYLYPVIALDSQNGGYLGIQFGF
jgi:TM2 domain-containing membrane protein YozV/TolB-like protein